MNEQLCFRIANKNIYLEKVLVTFNNIPLFFVCVDDNCRYLVLCTDVDQLEYIVVETNVDNILQMLLQKLSIKDTLLKGNSFWKVESGDTVENDNVEPIQICNIDMALLPQDSAFYEPLYKEDIEYIEQIKSSYWGTLSYDSLETSDIVYNDSSSLIIDVMGNITKDLCKLVEYYDLNPIDRIKHVFCEEQRTMFPALSYEKNGNSIGGRPKIFQRTDIESTNDDIIWLAA